MDIKFLVQTRRSNKCGSVRNDEIFNLHLGSGVGPWANIPRLLQDTSHIYWFIPPKQSIRKNTNYFDITLFLNDKALTENPMKKSNISMSIQTTHHQPPTRNSTKFHDQLKRLSILLSSIKLFQESVIYYQKCLYYEKCLENS